MDLRQKSRGIRSFAFLVSLFKINRCYINMREILKILYGTRGWKVCRSVSSAHYSEESLLQYTFSCKVGSMIKNIEYPRDQDCLMLTTHKWGSNLSVCFNITVSVQIDASLTNLYCSSTISRDECSRQLFGAYYSYYYCTLRISVYSDS